MDLRNCVEEEARNKNSANSRKDALNGPNLALLSLICVLHAQAQGPSLVQGKLQLRWILTPFVRSQCPISYVKHDALWRKLACFSSTEKNSRRAKRSSLLWIPVQAGGDERLGLLGDALKELVREVQLSGGDVPESLLKRRRQFLVHLPFYHLSF